MPYPEERDSSSDIFFRLTAFWAVCEAFAGGIMHAVKMPFTGLAVSSLAVLSIVLIAYHCRERMAILKATLLVCMFKLMLSPHSPPTAYLAVGFQGLMGHLLFMKRFSRAGAIILGVLALVESAIQRILVMIVIYGVTFWEAVNTYVKKTVGSHGEWNYLYWLAAGYVIIHLITGLLVGYCACELAKISSEGRRLYPQWLISHTESTGDWETQGKKRRKFRFLAWASFLMLLFFYFQSKIDPAHSILPTGKVIDIFLRALLILLAWYVIISPVLSIILKKVFEKGRSRYPEEFSRINALLPRTRHIFLKSAQMSSQARGLSRIRLFFFILVLNITGE